jgi:choice-of-anchor B domain-containing protein
MQGDFTMWMMHGIRKSVLRWGGTRPAQKNSRRTWSLRLQHLEDRIVPDGMSLVGNWHEQPGHYYADGWAEGNYAYIGHYSNASGVDIIDISDPTNPVQVANFKGTGGNNEIRDIETQNGIGFFSSDSYSSGGIFVVDLSDPTNPVQLARIDPSNGGAQHVHTLSVDGNYLYEADSATNNIRVFDISDPTNPTFVRSIYDASGGPVHEVTALNGRLYTAVISSTGSSEIYDISNVGDPNQPVPLLATIASGSYTHTAWPTEDGNYVAIARETLGGDVKIWDIHDLSNPVVASVISLPTNETYSMHQVMTQGNLLYISAYEAGVLVYDISDATNPVQVGSYKTYNGDVNGYAGCWGVYPFLGNDKILAFDIETGLYILSLDSAPALAGQRLQAPDAVAGLPNLASESLGVREPIAAGALPSVANMESDQTLIGNLASENTASSARSFAILDAAFHDQVLGEMAEGLSLPF